MTEPEKALAKLRKEYRPTMDAEVLHSWAADVVAALASLPEAPAVPVGDDAGIPFALIEKIENRIAYRIALGSTPRAIAEDVVSLAALASQHAVEGEAVACGCFRDGKMVAWVPGTEDPEGREFRLPEDTDARLPLFLRPAAADAGVREALRSALRDLVNACDVDAPLYTDDDDDKPVMTAARKALNLACRSLAAKREQAR